MIKKTVQPKQKSKKRFSIGAIIYGLVAAIVIVGGIAGFMLTQAPEGTDDRGQAAEGSTNKYYNDWSYFLAWDGKENKYYWRAFTTGLPGKGDKRLLYADGKKLSLSELQKLNISGTNTNFNGWGDYWGTNVASKELQLSEISPNITGELTSFDMFYLEFNPNGKSTASQDMIVSGKHYYRFGYQNPGDAMPKNWTAWTEDTVPKPGSGLISSYTTSLDYLTHPNSNYRRTVWLVRNGVVYWIKETKQGVWLEWQTVPANHWPSGISKIISYKEVASPQSDGSLVIGQILNTETGSWRKYHKPDGTILIDWK